MEKKSVVELALAVALGIVISSALRQCIPVLLPTAIAYISARLVRPLGVRLSAACRVNEKIGCAVYAVIVCAAATYVLTYASGRLVVGVRELMERLPEFAGNIAEMMDEIHARLPFLAGGESIPIARGALEEAAAYVGSAAAGAIGGLVQALPSGVASTAFSVVAFIYLTADLNGAAKSMRSIFPQAWSHQVFGYLGEAERAVFSYLRSYLIIMAVTFAELFVGLSLIGAGSPLAAAFVITFVDALPVLGCGCVLVPWAAWCLYVGDIARGVGLIILFGAIYLVRQLLEPRLVGRMTGVHPFAALLFIFIGWRLGGVLGILLAPVVLAMLRGRRYRRSDE